ncbi:MAG: glycosyltransferase [Bacteroidia bacterium]
MEKKKIVFLYSELASYFLACVDELTKDPSVEVHIVHWKVNKEAPFQFNISPSVHHYSRSSFDSAAELEKLIVKIEPSVIYCSGWLDKGYLKICKSYRNRIPVIVGLDNQWQNTFKQRLAVLLSPFRILNTFTHCWVPGEPQKKYALKLGFKKDHILTGFYSCDFDFFYRQYLQNESLKKTSFPKRFIFVGRYVEFKGIRNLWNAFIELQEEQPNDWELWCLGTGEIEPQLHPRIRHFGFVQPADMPHYISETGVFVLPSFFEPWGVALHEFAAAGFPVICSDRVGAASAFVQNGINGYIYDSKSKPALKVAMKEIMNADPSVLNEMAGKSVMKAKQITPVTWSAQLLKLIQ